MRKLLAVGSLLLVSLPLVAAAQPPPPPPPPAGGGGTGFEPSEPKMRVDLALIVGLPQGDETFDNVDTSPGLSLAFGYNVAPAISIFAGLRYFAIQTKEDVGADLSNYDFMVGGRYAFPVSPTAKIFVEAMLLYSTLSAEDQGVSVSESGIGFAARGGGMFRVSGNTSIGGALSFSTATVEFDGGTDVDASWLGIEGFVSFGF